MRAAFLLGLLLAAAGVTAPAAAAQEQRLFVDGDSLAVGTQPYFPALLPGWDIRTSAAVSRHAFEGPAVLRSMGSALAPVVAVSLGTNDDPRNTGAFRSAIRDVMAVAGPSRCVVWATIQRPPVAGTPYTAYNAILRAEGRRRPNLKVVRWRRLVRAHPEWLGPDRVHVDGVGYRARARAYADQIRRCP
jgi:hypothetical protein